MRLAMVVSPAPRHRAVTGPRPAAAGRPPGAGWHRGRRAKPCRGGAGPRSPPHDFSEVGVANSLGDDIDLLRLDAVEMIGDGRAALDIGPTQEARFGQRNSSDGVPKRYVISSTNQ